MKRSIFAATLALTPSLLFAQAITPAPTSTQAVLQARVTAPNDIKAGNGKDASSTKVRVSTGIVAPRLTNSVTLSTLPGAHDRVAAKDMTVVVSMVVDETGKPQNVAVAQSANDGLDKEVVEAIREYRFQPGTLDGQPYALPVRLQVMVQRGAQY